MTSKEEVLKVCDKLLEANRSKNHQKPLIKLTSPESYFRALAAKNNKNAWKLAHQRYIG